MEIPSWLIVAGVLVLVLIVVGAYALLGGPFPGRVFANINTADPSNTQFAPVSQWTKQAPVEGATCKGYLFGTTTSTGLLGNKIIILGSPSLSRLNEDPLPSDITVSDTPFPCVDIDSVNAIQNFHTCDRTLYNGQVVTDYPTDRTLCTKEDGTNAAYGEEETFYTYCPNTAYCNGQIGSIAVGYNWYQNVTDATPTDKERNFKCLNVPGGTTVSLADCDISTSAQQFRLVQNNAGSQTTQSTEAGKGMSGTMLRIQHRATGLCVYPTFTGRVGESLMLKDCGLTNNGFVWAIIPSTAFSDNDNCANNFQNSPNAIQDCQNLAYNDKVDQCVNTCAAKCRQSVDACGASIPDSGCTSKCSSTTNCCSKDGCKSISGCLSGCMETYCDTLNSCIADCNTKYIDKPIYTGFYGSSPSQIIYIGNADYNKTIPITDPSKLLQYIEDNNCTSMKQTLTGEVELGQFRLTNCNVPNQPPQGGDYNDSYCSDCAPIGCMCCNCKDTCSANAFPGPYNSLLVGVFFYNVLSYLSVL